MFELDPDYEALMNGVAFRHLRDKAKHNELASYSFDYERWPECKAKEVVTFFYANLGRGYEPAKWETVQKFKEFLNEISDKSLPKSVDIISEQLAYYLKRHWQMKFAREISMFPERLDFLIQEYQQNRPSGVKVLSLDDELSNIIRNHKVSVDSGESLIKIPAFPLLSDYIGGFNPCCVTLLTAATGGGKTNLAVSLALSASEIMPVLFFNMEMDFANFSARFIHHGADINNREWRSGSFFSDPYAQNRVLDFQNKRKGKHEIFITDGHALTKEQIITKIHSIFDGTRPGLVIVDYDQKIILPGKKDEWKELQEVISDLEEVAKRTKTHILLLSQADETGRAKASKRMEQSATSGLYFVKQKHPFIPNSDQYFIKGFKTRYSGDMVIEIGADLAKSKVWEIGYMQAPPAKAKGTHGF